MMALRSKTCERIRILSIRWRRLVLIESWRFEIRSIFFYIKNIPPTDLTAKNIVYFRGMMDTDINV